MEPRQAFWLILHVSALFVLGHVVHGEKDLATGHFAFADIEAFYQMYDTSKPDVPIVLFLHGEKFTSENWVNIGTLQMLQSKGYRTVAVDLPGFGKTHSLPYVDNNMRAEFVKASLEFASQGSNITECGAVLVTPSMSGSWAIPFLDRYGIMLKGWVALSPTGVMKWGGPWEDTHKKVKLLAMYGQHDERRSQADNLLKLFSRSSKVTIDNCETSMCYMEQPEAFHKHLSAFLKGCCSVDGDNS